MPNSYWNIENKIYHSLDKWSPENKMNAVAIFNAKSIYIILPSPKLLFGSNKETLQKYQWNKLPSPVIKMSRNGNSCLPLFLTSLHEIWQNFSGLPKVSGWWWRRAGPSVVVLVLQAAVCTNRTGLCEHQSAGETREGLITFRTFPFSLPTQVMRMCFCARGYVCAQSAAVQMFCAVSSVGQ